MSVMKSAFWSDHERRLDDPEYARAFVAATVAIMNTIAEQVTGTPVPIRVTLDLSEYRAEEGYYEHD